MTRRLEDVFLARIARQYTSQVALGNMPAPAIAAAENAPVATVHRWVSEARKRGMLPPGTPPGLCGGPVPKKPLGEVGHNVRRNVRRLREDRRMTYSEMAGQLAGSGRPIPVLGLRRIELGERRVDVDDLIALAALFAVEPALLLAPPSECATCHGTPPPGFSCNECSTAPTTAPTVRR